MNRKHLEKHLDIIQQNINRMSTNSFSIKGWLIALISAGFVFVSDSYSGLLTLASVILILGFALMDSLYLQTERKFRALYDIVIKDKEESIIKDLEINIKHNDIVSKKETRLINCIFSKSIVLPYSFILIYNLLLFLFIKFYI